MPLCSVGGPLNPAEEEALVTKKMMRRRWRYVFVCLLLAFIPENICAEQPQRLIFLHYWTEALSGGIEEMVAAFNQTHPQYHVKAAGFEHETFKTSIGVMLAAGNPPDFFSYWAGARVQAIVDAGYLAPIDDLWEKAQLNERFSQSIAQASTYNGKKYILPVTQHYVCFFYNKKLFQTLHLEPPRNWKDFLSVCKQIQAKGIAPIALGARERWPAQFWFDYLLLRTAGYDFRSRLMTGQAAYTEPAVRHAFMLWSELITDKFFIPNPNLYDWSEAAKMVYTERAAMTLMGTWIIGLFESKLGWHPGDDFDFFPFPIIDPEQPVVALGPIDAIAIPREGHVSAAKDALQYFSDNKPQMAMSKGSGALAPSSRIPFDFYSDLQQRILNDIKRSSYWAFNYDLATPPPVASVGLKSFSAFLDRPEELDGLLKNMDKASMSYRQPSVESQP